MPWPTGSWAWCSGSALKRTWPSPAGVAKNQGVVRALEERLKVKLFIPPEPQIIGALGAALFARDLYLSESPEKERALSA